MEASRNGTLEEAIKSIQAVMNCDKVWLKSYIYRLLYSMYTRLWTFQIYHYIGLGAQCYTNQDRGCKIRKICAD